MRRKLVAFLTVLSLWAVTCSALEISQIEFDLQVEQGQEYTFSFTVRNETDDSQVVTIYLGDWERDSEGVNRFYEPETQTRSLSSWISFFPATIGLEAEESDEVIVTLSVPSDQEVSLDGTYWGIIFVQGEPRPAERGGSTVMAVERFGIKVYATVSGTEKTSGAVQNVEVTSSDDALTFSVTYENSGNVKQRVKGELTVIDRTGEQVREAQMGVFPVLPGNRRTVEISTDPLTQGIYQLTAVLDYGGEALTAGVLPFRVR